MSEKPVHICIADDDDDDCLLFADVLQDIKIATTLTMASNGVELMETLRTLQEQMKLPNLLFLDLNMPVMNGFECLKKLKANEKLRHLPVIIYSTSAQMEAVDTAYQNGAVLFFKKPDSLIKLRRVLEQILSIDWDQRFEQRAREEFLIDI